MKKWTFTLACAIALAFAGHSQSISPALQQLFSEADAASLTPTNASRPIIGITASTTRGTSVVSSTYYQAITRAGGLPFIIPVDTTTAYLAQAVKQIDGLLLIGGVDVDPSFFGETAHERLGTVDTLRDVNELKLIRLAANRNIPMLGICRGCQMLNVAFGGTLIQDIPSQVADTSITHRITAGAKRIHAISIEKESKFYEILGKTSLEVNSAHHQAVGKLAPGARIAAKSADGVVEAIDFYPTRRIMGTQWHPEGFRGTDDDMNSIFRFFLGETRLFKQAKDMHSRMLSVDSHTDAPLSFVRGRGELGKHSQNRVNIAKMQEGMLDAQYLAAWVGSDSTITVDGKKQSVALPLTDATFAKAWKRTLQLIDVAKDQISQNEHLCNLARSEADVRRLKAEGKKALLLGVENGLGLGNDIGKVKTLAQMGVTYITLCHTWDNQICHSSTHTADAKKGLTAFGRKLVKEMNRQGMLIDLSHCSDGTFWDVMKLSSKPVVCTHSGARALCDNDRNLSDDQLRAIARNGGVVQTVAYYEFLSRHHKATIDDFIDHIHHMVKVAGIDHVGIGTDFDGGGGVPGLEADNDLINITMRLIERGYSETDIAKIWGGNFFRVLSAQ
ncbi:MAG: membrane dipeptidase [Bacteroidales bacterium]|nr:membrane dipeptidase [Bacteroidales bacterium]